MTFFQPEKAKPFFQRHRPRMFKNLFSVPAGECNAIPVFARPGGWKLAQVNAIVPIMFSTVTAGKMMIYARGGGFAETGEKLIPY